MNLLEFNQRRFYINSRGLIFDECLNEYRNKKGNIEYLQVVSNKLIEIYNNQEKEVKEQLE